MAADGGAAREEGPRREPSPERWRQIEAVVDRALELPTAERAAYVAAACADDEALRREVESYLRACEDAERSATFLAQPAAELVRPVIADLGARSGADEAARVRHHVVAATIGPRYELEREIGRGGMATVFLARDVERDRRVAVKVLHPYFARQLEGRRFVREIRITAALEHPNIVPLLESDVGAVAGAGLPYYVMPVAAGGSLRERLGQERQLPFDEVVRVARDVADALDHAHARGIVHRDVKPQNILLDGGRALVADFGIARAVEASASQELTESGAVIGTPAYMSPEQAVGEPVGVRGDVYALGCVVYEMLAGEPPYQGASTQAVLAKHVQAPIPDVRLMRRTVGLGVQRALERALAKAPADRYGSAGAFVAALERALAADRQSWRVTPRRAAALALVVALPAAGWLAVRLADGRGPDGVAARSFDAGLGALAEWDLARADSLLEDAVGRDPTHARASLWLAQTRAWRSLPAEQWAALAERVHADGDGLTAWERRLANGLVLLAKGRYADACGIYDAMRRAGAASQDDVRAFAAWFGLGQCRTMDRLVVPDRSSPSRWRFRSNYREAIEAYRQAFGILPSVYRGYEHDGFARLRLLLLVSRDLVLGRDSAGAPYYARLGMPGDTLALIPYPAADVGHGGRQTIPPGFQAALANQRQEFRRIAAGWSVALPRSAGAKEAVAIALDMLEDPTALDTLLVARRLASDSARALRLAAAEAVLRIRLGVSGAPGHLQTASRTIDSLLERRAFSPSDAIALAPLAAFGGRCRLAEQLFREVPATGGLARSPHLDAAAQALLARTALGCGRGPTNQSPGTLLEEIARAQPGLSQSERQSQTERLLLRPALLDAVLDSAVIDHLATSTTNQLLLAARAITRRDTTAVRRALADYDAAWQDADRPPTPDMALVAARLRVITGDTAGAIRQLDRVLLGTRHYDPTVFRDPARAAALVRAMTLRADLAAVREDREAARQWGSVAALLWSGADPELQPTVQRMRQYAAAR